MIDDFAKAHLHDKLRGVRDALVWKLEGLSDADVRRPMTPTGTNLLGLVKHNALSDARYFGEVFERTPPVDLPPWDTAGWWAASHWATERESRADVLDLYRLVGAHVDSTIEALPIDAPGYVPWWQEKVMLFNVMAARLCDATRHAGHADILRETIDGSVGVSRETAWSADGASWEGRRAEIERVARAAATISGAEHGETLVAAVPRVCQVVSRLVGLHLEGLTSDDIGWVWDIYRVTLHDDHADATGGSDSELHAAQRTALATGSVSALVAEDGARVGLIRITDDGSELTIRDLAITPERQGQGLGTAAITLVFALAATSDKDVVLRVLDVNPRARALYERLGFEVDEKRSRSTQMRLRAPRVHRWAIPEREYIRHETRRGRRYAYDTLDPTTTALVVVDLVPFFYESNATCHAITPNVRLLADALRGAGGAVAWVVPGDPGPRPWAREFLGDEVAERFRRSGGAGPVAGRLGPGLEAREVDLLVEKTATSALFPGSSTLDYQLRERGIETVVVAGTLTEVCVAGTARDAATLGYRTILVADATAGRDDESHNATLTTIYRTFGDVRSTEDVLGLVSGCSVST